MRKLSFFFIFLLIASPLIYLSCGGEQTSEQQQAEYFMTDEDLSRVLKKLDPEAYMNLVADSMAVPTSTYQLMAEEDSTLWRSLNKMANTKRTKVYFDYNGEWRFFPQASGLDSKSIIKAFAIINSPGTHDEKIAKLDELLLSKHPEKNYNPIIDEPVKVKITSTVPSDLIIDFFVDGFWLGGKQSVSRIRPLYPDSVNLRVEVTNNPSQELKGEFSINGKSQAFTMATHQWRVKKNVKKFAVAEFDIDTSKYSKPKPVPPPVVGSDAVN